LPPLIPQARAPVPGSSAALDSRRWAGVGWRSVAGSRAILPRPSGRRRSQNGQSERCPMPRLQTGIRPLRIHDLRATFNSRARRQGIPVEIAARLSGHARSPCHTKGTVCVRPATQWSEAETNAPTAAALSTSRSGSKRIVLSDWSTGGRMEPGGGLRLPGASVGVAAPSARELPQRAQRFLRGLRRARVWRCWFPRQPHPRVRRRSVCRSLWLRQCSRIDLLAFAKRPTLLEARVVAGV
jgi:hypothetical protein